MHKAIGYIQQLSRQNGGVAPLPATVGGAPPASSANSPAPAPAAPAASSGGGGAQKKGPSLTELIMGIGTVPVTPEGRGRAPRDGDASAKVFIGITKDAATQRGFNLMGKLLGPKGAYMKHIMTAVPNVKALLRGPELGSPNDPLNARSYSTEPMHIFITGPTQQAVDAAKQLAENLVETVRKEWEETKMGVRPVAPAAAHAPRTPSHHTGVGPDPAAAAAYAAAYSYAFPVFPVGAGVAPPMPYGYPPMPYAPYAYQYQQMAPPAMAFPTVPSAGGAANGDMTPEQVCAVYALCMCA